MQLVLAAILALTTSFTAWFLQKHEMRVVYPFDRTHSTPAAAGEARLSEQRINTADGESLVVWTAPPGEARATVLYFTGNAGTLANRASRYGALIDRGFGVVAPAYRGSSGSSGRPSEEALTDDAQLVASSVAQLLGTTPGALVLYGESLGSAVAVKLASEGIGDAVVLEAPFTSVPDLADIQYPGHGMGELVTQIWDSRSRIAGVDAPLLIVHGTEDNLVPVTMGRELFETAPSRDKTFLPIEGAPHSGSWTAEGQRAIYAFLARQ